MADDPIIDALNPMPKRDGETDRETRIRRRAYELWEAAGRPEGREQEHWYAAEQEHEREGATASMGTPLQAGETIPAIRSPGGLSSDQKDALRNDRNEAPEAPKTSGAPRSAPDTSRSTVANRDIEGPRKASTTPRPTDKPIAGR